MYNKFGAYPNEGVLRKGSSTKGGGLLHLANYRAECTPFADASWSGVVPWPEKDGGTHSKWLTLISNYLNAPQTIGAFNFPKSYRAFLVHLYGCTALLREERLNTAQKGRFCVREGSVTPKEEGFAQQTQIMLPRGLSGDDVTAKAYPVSIKLESLLKRYSWKKVPQKYSRISYGRDARRRRQIY